MLTGKIYRGSLWNDCIFRQRIKKIRLLHLKNVRHGQRLKYILFHREADEHFYECGLLRLDLRSDYETADSIVNIISLIKDAAYDLFYCNIIATKAVPQATERLKALRELGFATADKLIVGHDGTKYGDYYILENKSEYV